MNITVKPADMLRMSLADAVQLLVDRVVDTAQARQGASIHARTLQAPNPWGFMVAARPDAELVVDMDDADAVERVEQWVRDHARDARRHDLFVGVWVMDDGRVCLDLSERCGLLEHALRVGRHRAQKAIWDLAAGAAIAC